MPESSAAPEQLARVASGPAGSGVIARRGELAGFVALAYLLSWGWLLPIVLSGGDIKAGVGWPTHVPALLGPLAAALLVTARGGREAVVDLLRRMVSAKIAPRWWALALSPFVLLVAAAGAAALGWISVDLSGLAVLPGVPTGWGIAAVVAIVLVVNGFGEETGWRGFAQPVLQRRHGPLAATLLVASIWAVWHLPMFLVLSSFRSFSPLMLVGWTIGLVGGAVVLGFLYNRSGGSILLPALWHGGFNLLAATAVGAGFLGAASTVLVIVAAAALVIVELVRTHSGHPSVLLPPTGAGLAGRHTSP